MYSAQRQRKRCYTSYDTRHHRRSRKQAAVSTPAAVRKSTQQQLAFRAQTLAYFFAFFHAASSAACAFTIRDSTRLNSTRQPNKTHPVEWKRVPRLPLPLRGPLLLHPPDGCRPFLPVLLRRAEIFRENVRVSWGGEETRNAKNDKKKRVESHVESRQDKKQTP